MKMMIVLDNGEDDNDDDGYDYDDDNVGDSINDNDNYCNEDELTINMKTITIIRIKTFLVMNFSTNGNDDKYGYEYQLRG